MNKFEQQAAKELTLSFGKFALGGLVGGGVVAGICLLATRSGFTDKEIIMGMLILATFALLIDTVRSMYRSKVKELEYIARLEEINQK